MHKLGVVHNRLLYEIPRDDTVALWRKHIGLDSAGNVRFVGFGEARTEHRVLLKVPASQRSSKAGTKAKEGLRVETVKTCKELEDRGGCYESKAIHNWSFFAYHGTATQHMDQHGPRARIFTRLLLFVNRWQAVGVDFDADIPGLEVVNSDLQAVAPDVPLVARSHSTETRGDRTPHVATDNTRRVSAESGARAGSSAARTQRQRTDGSG